MSREWRFYLADMIDAGEKVLRYTKGMDAGTFAADEKTRDAVLRNLEIVGEAAKQIPAAERYQLPRVDWRRIAGFRDIVAHAYFGIDRYPLIGGPTAWRRFRLRRLSCR